MPDDPTKSIAIFEAIETIEGAPENQGMRPFHARGGVREYAAKVLKCSVDVLSQNMTEFVTGVNTMLSESSGVTGPFKIDTVEVACQVSGNGTIGFAGSGATVQGGSTFKIIFKKQ